MAAAIEADVRKNQSIIAEAIYGGDSAHGDVAGRHVRALVRPGHVVAAEIKELPVIRQGEHALVNAVSCARLNQRLRSAVRNHRSEEHTSELQSLRHLV